MRDLSTDMSDSAANDGNFGFAFSDNDSSDRVLRIEIIADDTSDPNSDYEDSDSVCGNRKRRRDKSDENGEEATDSDDSEGSSVAKVKTLHISSHILAERSPFFHKLFKNGMRESQQRHVTLRVDESEEEALIDVLNFMHNNTLSATAVHDLLGVLITADKFEVTSCMRYCTKLLRKIPMSLEYAHLYFDLPSSILMAEAVQPLLDAAKRYFAERYMELSQEEAMALPLYALEAILSGDDFKVGSEDALFDFILKWAGAHYPDLEERREILTNRITRFICFTSMSSKKLREALTCPFFDDEEVSQLVLQALFFKVGLPYRERLNVTQDQGATNRGSKDRVFKQQPIKVAQLQFPRPSCAVYFNLKKEVCANLFPSGRVDSKAFRLGGQGFFLSAQCNKDEESSLHHFGLFVGMQDKGSLPFTFNYELAVCRKPLEELQSKYNGEFQIRYKGKYTFTGGKFVGNQNLFELPWTVFMADNSEYIINGMLNLRAKLTVKQ